MKTYRLHFLALSVVLLLLIVFGRDLFLLGTETNLAGVARNFALVFGGSFLAGLVVGWVVNLLSASSKLGFPELVKNSLICASAIYLFFYGYAIWFWAWPTNDQKDQPMNYEGYWHWIGFVILLFSIALWIFWNRNLRKKEKSVTGVSNGT